MQQFISGERSRYPFRLRRALDWTLCHQDVPLPDVLNVQLVQQISDTQLAYSLLHFVDVADVVKSRAGRLRSERRRELAPRLELTRVMRKADDVILNIRLNSLRLLGLS